MPILLYDPDLDASQPIILNLTKSPAKSDNLFIPKNQAQTDLMRIRNTIERLRKEYTEKFPDEKTSLGSTSKVIPLDLSSTSESPLDLTSFTVHNSPPPFLTSQTMSNVALCNPSSLLISPSTSNICSNAALHVIDNTEAGPSATVPFLGKVPYSPKPPENPPILLNRDNRTPNLTSKMPNYLPTVERKIKNPEGVVEQARNRRKKDNLDSPINNRKKIRIFNLSNQALNPYELSLLEKGLSFCPNNNPDPFILFLDLHKFGRKLTLQRYFTQQKKKKRKR